MSSKKFIILFSLLLFFLIACNGNNLSETRKRKYQPKTRFIEYTDVVELLPASMVSVEMVADNVGEWMYHCHVSDHITAGMMATYIID